MGASEGPRLWHSPGPVKKTNHEQLEMIGITGLVARFAVHLAPERRTRDLSFVIRQWSFVSV